MFAKRMRVRRAVVFEVNWADAQLDWLLAEFRLIVNKSIRAAREHKICSRTRLAQLMYRSLGQEHDIYKQYIPSAFEVALGALKAWRRRTRNHANARPPYLKHLLLKAENQSYRLNRETGQLSIPIRAKVTASLNLPLSNWHREILRDSEWTLGSLTVVPGRVILVFRRVVARPYAPRSALAFDTNEDSLDGVVAFGHQGRLVTVPFGGVREVQLTHFRRRRRIARRKVNDRRVRRRLLKREGSRERCRVKQRLHRVSKTVVEAAKDAQAAVVIENLTLVGAGGRSRRVNRRLSSWPRGELHRQIEYKAALAGVPIIKVNPAWTSKTCPVCGARRRDRVGQDFVCLVCDWEMDRQHNAACNILQSALASNEALARGVRFHPGALRDDVMSPHYDLSALRTGAREEPSGVELGVLP